MPPSNPMGADNELKNPCHSFSMAFPVWAGFSMVDPSAACISSLVYATTDKLMVNARVSRDMNITNMTTATNSQEKGLVFDLVSDRSDFSSVQVDYASGQGMPDRVPHNPQHRLGAGDERVAFPAPRTVEGFSLPLILTYFRNKHTSILAVGTETIIRDTARQFSAGAAFRPDCSGAAAYSRGGS